MNAVPRGYRKSVGRRTLLSASLCVVAVQIFVMSAVFVWAQKQEIVWSAQEKPIAEQMHGLRQLSDDVRAGVTKQLALQIRQLPATPNKLRLAVGLANLSTEGDFGHDTLQEVATTLADTLRQQPVPDDHGPPPAAYVELAQLVRYEIGRASLDGPQFKAAMAKLEGDDQRRQGADFTLTDLQGKTWSLRELKGKVVLVNFWATW